MKIQIKTLALTAGIVIASAVSSSATIIDQWDFTYADGTGLAAADSNNGTSLGNNSAVISVQNNELEFGSDNDGVTGQASTFRTATLSVSPISSGIVQVSWDVVSASMTATDTADGLGRLGFSLRDTDPSNNDFAFARLVYDGTANEFQLQYADATANNDVVATFAGNTLSDLNIRMVADLDNAGSAGSFQLYYTLGAGSEVTAVGAGSIDAGVQVDAFRTAQQITNGGTDWRAGDTMTIDNLSVEVIPEPGTAGLIALGGALLAFYRRRT